MADNAHEKIQNLKGSSGKGPLVRFKYPCPVCKSQDSLFGEPIGRESRVYCEECLQEKESGLVGGVHDIMDTYSRTDPERLHLKNMPASRVRPLTSQERQGVVELLEQYQS